MLKEGNYYEKHFYLPDWLESPIMSIIFTIILIVITIIGFFLLKETIKPQTPVSVSLEIVNEVEL